MERLLRKLLAMPNAPAVVLLHAYAWLRPDPVEGSFYSNAEAELEEFARYYGLQSVSVKGCCYEAMRKALPGFQVGMHVSRSSLSRCLAVSACRVRVHAWQLQCVLRAVLAPGDCAAREQHAGPQGPGVLLRCHPPRRQHRPQARAAQLTGTSACMAPKNACMRMPPRFAE